RSTTSRPRPITHSHLHLRLCPSYRGPRAGSGIPFGSPPRDQHLHYFVRCHRYLYASWIRDYSLGVRSSFRCVLIHHLSQKAGASPSRGSRESDECEKQTDARRAREGVDLPRTLAFVPLHCRDLLPPPE
ncbi:hypothetical protein PMAYCL1PPCAC_15359, partial [Pristionchus mayeri]